MAITGAHTFCWFELATTGCAEAKRFYAELFGWSYESIPMPDGNEYTLIKQGDANVGALFELTPETGLGHLPPNWSAYVAVESADAAVRNAKELGASIMKEPFDVMEMGAWRYCATPPAR